MTDRGIVDTARDRLGAVGVWSFSLASASARETADAAARIERLGYGALWFAESPTGKEAYVNASQMLSATESIVVATGIASIWGRDPRATYGAAQALGDAFPGRFLLGLGVSHASIVQARGHDYRRPVAAMRAYLDGIDKVAENYSGAVADPPVPIVLAALGPKMIALAGERSAGAHTYLVTPAHTAHTRESLGRGALLAAEQAVLVERDAARARERIREFLAFYLPLPNYTRNLLEFGFKEADFASGGSDRLLDAVVAWGDPEQIAERIREHRDAGADHVAIQPLAANLPDELGQLEELAPIVLA